MKKLFLIPAAALLIAGCAKDLKEKGPVQEHDGVTPTSYLKISLQSAPVTRAEVEERYQDGTADENKVTMVRFYFFDEKGNAAAAWKLTGDNSGTESFESFIDWYPSDADFQGTTNGNKETVEKIGTATLGINATERPAKVVAIINPSQDVLKLTKPQPTTDQTSLSGVSLEELTDAVYDFNTGLTEAGKFVMSNSVYLEGTTLINAVAIEDKNYGATIEAAAANPVTIYVERVVARLDLSIGLTPATGKDVIEGIYDVTKKEGDKELDYTVDDKKTKIYVKLLGWNITSTTDKAKLVKDISPLWTQDKIFGTGETLWNSADYHRSFWAINPDKEKDELGYQYGSFGKTAGSNAGDLYPAQALPIPTEENTPVTVYMHENAGQSATVPYVKLENATKVIIAAQLVKADGTALELAEWAYKKYELENLKEYLANSVLGNLFWENTEAETDAEKYEKILPTDLDFKTATELETGEANYYVYAVLAEDSEENEEKKWFLRGDDGTFGAMASEATVNEYIRNRVNHVKVWKGGHTYYYFDIKHLSNTAMTGEGEDATPMPGHIGVVRNHLYEAKVRSLAGLGTPVYKPEEVIIPETPEYDESIITATINILQWRVVRDEYDIAW